MGKIKITTTIDEELKAEVERRGIPMSQAIEEALRAYLFGNGQAEPTPEADSKKEIELVRIKASKYPFKCVRCGVKYDAGTPGWWDPQARTMICDACYYSSLSQQKHGGKLYKLLLEQRRLEAEIKKLKQEEKELLEEIEAKEKKLAELTLKWNAAELIDSIYTNTLHIAKAVEEILQNPQLAEELRDQIRRFNEIAPRVIREMKVGTNYE